jgi:hypothetical protein
MKKIDYYGTKDNYIHLKFGDCRKAYHFTKKFTKEHLDFAEKYQRYFEKSQESWEDFKSPFAVVAYAFKKKIPVHFYYNFTDTPATDYDDIIAYLVKENTYVHESGVKS